MAMINKILFGDCRDSMKKMYNKGVKVQMCVTSPPYYGLRDYGVDGQIGLEETPEKYIKNLVNVFRHVWDILDDDGILWVNIGDSYYNYRPGKSQSIPKQSFTDSKQDAPQACSRRANKFDNLKEKDLIGIPWMLAFALRNDGWHLRQDIIWNKPNPMPESVKDRCTKSHEYLFLFSKSKNYFFDSFAIKEQTTNNSPIFQKQSDEFSDERNKRSVWTIATSTFKDAHFATYPIELIEPCILSGTSEKGHCPKCGSRFVRDVQKTRLKRNELKKSDPRYRPNSYKGNYGDINGKADAGFLFSKTLGFIPTCNCGVDPVPDIVFDPFMGSGTTAFVSLKHGRNFLGCELNMDYKKFQIQRIREGQKYVNSRRKLFP